MKANQRLKLQGGMWGIGTFEWEGMGLKNIGTHGVGTYGVGRYGVGRYGVGMGLKYAC